MCSISRPRSPVGQVAQEAANSKVPLEPPAPPPPPKVAPPPAAKAVEAPVVKQPMGIAGARKKNAPKAKRSTGSLRGGGGSINASTGSGVNI